MHYSKKYDNAPMPHSIFFSGGYAIHATPHVGNLGRPASHGCVRLHPEHAAQLYTMTKGEYTTITIKE
jgi:lipoprotein-anchoring transpeptidase ErfK/SrfK